MLRSDLLFSNYILISYCYHDLFLNDIFSKPQMLLLHPRIVTGAVGVFTWMNESDNETDRNPGCGHTKGSLILESDMNFNSRILTSFL